MQGTERKVTAVNEAVSVTNCTHSAYCPPLLYLRKRKNNLYSLTKFRQHSIWFTMQGKASPLVNLSLNRFNLGFSTLTISLSWNKTNSSIWAKENHSAISTGKSRLAITPTIKSHCEWVVLQWFPDTLKIHSRWSWAQTPSNAKGITMPQSPMTTQVPLKNRTRPL